MSEVPSTQHDPAETLGSFLTSPRGQAVLALLTERSRTFNLGPLNADDDLILNGGGLHRCVYHGAHQEPDILPITAEEAIPLFLAAIEQPCTEGYLIECIVAFAKRIAATAPGET